MTRIKSQICFGMICLALTASASFAMYGEEGEPPASSIALQVPSQQLPKNNLSQIGKQLLAWGGWIKRSLFSSSEVPAFLRLEGAMITHGPFSYLDLASLSRARQINHRMNAQIGQAISNVHSLAVSRYDEADLEKREIQSEENEQNSRTHLIQLWEDKTPIHPSGLDHIHTLSTDCRSLTALLREDGPDLKRAMDWPIALANLQELFLNMEDCLNESRSRNTCDSTVISRFLTGLSSKLKKLKLSSASHRLHPSLLIQDLYSKGMSLEVLVVGVGSKNQLFPNEVKTQEFTEGDFIVFGNDQRLRSFSWHEDQLKTSAPGLGIEILSTLPNLEKLDLYSLSVTDQALMQLVSRAQGLTTLRLDLRNVKHLTEHGIDAIASLPYLRHLHVEGGCSVGAELLLYQLLQSLPQLKTLSLNLVQPSLDRGLLKSILKMDQLSQLRLGRHLNLRPEVLERLSRHPTLEVLIMNGSRRLSKVGMKYFENSLRLKHLEIVNEPNFYDRLKPEPLKERDLKIHIGTGAHTLLPTDPETW